MGLLLTAGNAAAQPSWHGLALGMPAGGAAAVLREEGESVVEHRAENGAIELSFAARGPIEKHVTLHFVRDRLQTMLIGRMAAMRSAVMRCSSRRKAIWPGSSIEPSRHA